MSSVLPHVFSERHAATSNQSDLWPLSSFHFLISSAEHVAVMDVCYERQTKMISKTQSCVFLADGVHVIVSPSLVSRSGVLFTHRCVL